VSTIPLITIFVRHGKAVDGKSCKYAGDEFSKRCQCRKHLRWSVNGQQYRKQAGTRSWTEAETVKRELEDQLSGKVSKEIPTSMIEDAVRLFIQDKRIQGVGDSGMKKYTLELLRLATYCAGVNVYTVQGITRELLTGYAATWEALYPSSITRSKVKERCSAFLRYCYETKWLDRVPNLPKIKVDEAPTMPLVRDEYSRLLDALYVVNPRRWDGKKSSQGLTGDMHTRIRALIQLMRWSGLAIIDAVSLPKSHMVWDADRKIFRVVTSRQKTGTDVSVPLPPDVSAEIKPLYDRHAEYVLFPEEMKWTDIARTYTNRYIRPAFEAAGIECDTHMVSHRLRDTFAVFLLEKGMSIGDVANALGDTVKVTEKHYAKWVPGRQDRLSDLVIGTWAPHSHQ
jgi:integrase/recombinase XerD